jgi:hypothetical protein
MIEILRRDARYKMDKIDMTRLNDMTMMLLF